MSSQRSQRRNLPPPMKLLTCAAAEGWLSGEKPMAAVEGSTAAGEVPAAADRELVAADEGLAAENEGR